MWLGPHEDPELPSDRPGMGLTSQQPVQPRRRLLLRTGQDPRIRIHRERDRRVPEHLLYDLRVLSVDETERRGCVPKIVEPHVRETGGLEDRLEVPLL